MPKTIRNPDTKPNSAPRILLIGPHTSDGNSTSAILAHVVSSDDIQLFLSQKTMDTIQPLLTVFKKQDAQQTVVVPPTSGQPLNRFDWLVFRPQAHAVKPFEADQSARQDKYRNTK